MIGLRLSAGGQTVVELSNDSIQEVQTAADIITEKRPDSELYYRHGNCAPVGHIILYYIILLKVHWPHILSKERERERAIISTMKYY